MPKSYQAIAKQIASTITGLSVTEKKRLAQILAKGEIYQEIAKDWSNARNEREEEITLTPIFQEYLRLLLDYRINTVICGGCAQIGKSLFAIIAYSYTTCKLGYNALFLFPQQQALERLVPLNHRPIVENWEKTLYTGCKRNIITNLKTIKSLSGAAVMYSYSVHKTQANEGAAASTAIVSVSTDVLYVDEVSQYPKGAIEMAFRRLDASRIPSQPIRLLGTAGNGGGIEKFIREADLQFYPSVICNNCHNVAFLDPYGALLKSVESIGSNNETIKVYLSTTGRPIKWHGKNGQDSNTTNDIQICCPTCSSPISDAQIEQSSFRERRSHQTLTNYLNTYDKDSHSISIELSPLLRGNGKMPKLIKEGLNTSSPVDWVQQALGKPSEFGLTAIPTESILQGFNRELPIAKTSEYSGGIDSVIIAGIDQGHSSDHVVICRYYYDMSMYDINLISETSTREFLYFGAVSREQIPELMDCWGVKFGFIDNEPSIDSAAEIVRQTTCLVMADQQGRQKADFVKGVAHDGGHNFPCVKISHRKFGRNLITGFSRFNGDGQPLYQFASTVDWIRTASRELSPMRHLSSVVYDPETGILKRPIDHVDHYFFATLFCEAAFSYFLEFDTSDAGGGMSLSSWV